MVGSEPVAPYERPHLSKGYLTGAVPRANLGLRPLQQYRELEIELMTGETVVDIGVDRREAQLHGGRALSWDLFCIATGSSARRLEGFVHGLYLREIADADALRSALVPGGELAVVGAGFIGCEVAAAAATSGLRVRVYEALAQPLIRVLGPELGGYVAGVHRKHGVELHVGADAPASLASPLVIGAGSLPRTALAARAGLEVDGGIAVDALGRTSADGVFAAGDATRFSSPLYETRIRVEHFQTARRQGFAVGRAMAGATEPYSEVPWFWSDQYDMNLQYAGAGLPWDETVIRGELGRPPFTVFYLEGGRPIAAAGVNDHHTVARARHLMETRRPLTRPQLEDPGFDLRRGLA
jgi:3-phenylpropionate/trans-cinnamate dioxygenase ferredoxin reductase component